MDEGREIRVSGKHDPAEITPESDRQTGVFGRERLFRNLGGNQEQGREELQPPGRIESVRLCMLDAIERMKQEEGSCDLK